MAFAERINEIKIAVTTEGAERAYDDALTASYNVYISDIERTNDHATAERGMDRRNEAAYDAWCSRERIA